MAAFIATLFRRCNGTPPRATIADAAAACRLREHPSWSDEDDAAAALGVGAVPVTEAEHKACVSNYTEMVEGGATSHESGRYQQQSYRCQSEGQSDKIDGNVDAPYVALDTVGNFGGPMPKAHTMDKSFNTIEGTKDQFNSSEIVFSIMRAINSCSTFIAQQLSPQLNRMIVT